MLNTAAQEQGFSNDTFIITADEAGVEVFSHGIGGFIALYFSTAASPFYTAWANQMASECGWR